MERGVEVDQSRCVDGSAFTPVLADGRVVSLHSTWRGGFVDETYVRVQLGMAHVSYGRPYGQVIDVLGLARRYAATAPFFRGFLTSLKVIPV